MLQGPSKEGSNGLLNQHGAKPEVCPIPKKYIAVFQMLEGHFEGRVLVQAVETTVGKLSKLQCNGSSGGLNGSLDLSLFQSAGDY